MKFLSLALALCLAQRAQALDIPNLEGLKAFHGSQAAPEFPKGQWLNAEKPLSLKSMRGRVVLLDFWTYCCINCMHLLPDLHMLEEKYKGQLVIVGVHSAKFSSEQALSKIRKAVLRFKISHPVFNDNELKVWNGYGVQAWPTLVLIAPDGSIVGEASGEGNGQLLDHAIAGVIRAYAGALKTQALPLRAEASLEKATGLSFPGKVLADPKGGRFFVADSGHDRIVIARLSDGQVIAEAGTGRPGLHDGAFAQAAFQNPQGMALSEDGTTLYVADTGNHALRALDIPGQKVSTLCGDGKQAKPGASGGQGIQAELNSPWDLALWDGGLYAAMAGAHQIWRMDLSSLQIQVWAGSGAEELKDGTRAAACLAQPSGLTTDGHRLFSADSESSSIRALSPGEGGGVRTLVGKGLFAFGDRELSPQLPELQHPLGIHWASGLLYVADSFNNRIKTVDPEGGETRFLAGSGIQGFSDGAAAKAQFDEPSGLWVAGGKLYVADTNNNAVRVLDLGTGMVSTFAWRGL
jgi:thiol-disulfide isomerase/thioredoxin